MSEFFRGWPRKIGVVTLVMACIFAGGWVRSYFFLDDVTIGGESEDVPQSGIGGEWPSAAIEKLLAHLVAGEFDAEMTVAVEGRSSDTHLEFIVPLRRHMRIPKPSAN